MDEKQKKNRETAKFIKLLAVATTLISCFRVIAINSYDGQYFTSNNVAQISLETHQVIQIGVAAVLFAITLWLVADVLKE